MLRNTCLSVIVLGALLMAGCAPIESVNPLSDPATAKADARLAGFWAGRMNDGDAYLMIFAKEGAAMDFVLTVHDSKEGANVLQYELFCSELDGRGYMNLQQKTSPDPLNAPYKLSPRYIFARYELAADGTLTLWYMDDDLVRKAIDAGAIEGTTEGNATLTAPSAKLAQFVKATDSALMFSLVGHFQKVKVDLPPASS